MCYPHLPWRVIGMHGRCRCVTSFRRSWTEVTPRSAQGPSVNTPQLRRTGRGTPQCAFCSAA